ncbi:DUF6928 family protein [Planotetraspora mira]|uniref:Uncharacterized protein n=1 Tax=Planotetraspora mira TaxID=58121 RepID=A0A8J3TNL0_9ACTN|nr:hypothetical protein [Planotetraspora mira]GII29132.1 hypothetical protein Pmi06nite_25740 [Planotetraspora mira]
MGAKTGLLIHAEGDVADALQARPALDRDACRRLISRMSAGKQITQIEDGTLGDDVYPPKGTVYLGCFPGLDIITGQHLMIDRPSLLAAEYVAHDGRRTYLHAMHSVVDWLAFGVWHDGTLVRALSLAPDEGIIENVGEVMPFEVPYWAEDHPVEAEFGEEPYPFPFHPLDLGEAALERFFGFCVEGSSSDFDDFADIDPFEIPLMGFRLTDAE